MINNLKLFFLTLTLSLLSTDSEFARTFTAFRSSVPDEPIEYEDFVQTKPPGGFTLHFNSLHIYSKMYMSEQKTRLFL